jgi:hypothetical protein
VSDAASRPVLARAKSASDALKTFRDGAQARDGFEPAKNHLRSLGLIDDEVVDVKGAAMPAELAREQMGPLWYKSTQFTGKETLTRAGWEELAKLEGTGLA